MRHQDRLFALLVALVLGFTGHPAAAARPRSEKAATTATVVHSASSSSLAVDQAARLDDAASSALASSSAAQTSASETSALGLSKQEASSVAATAAREREVQQTLAKLADAVARWGEFVRKKQLSKIRPKASRSASSSALVAVREGTRAGTEPGESDPEKGSEPVPGEHEKVAEEQGTLWTTEQTEIDKASDEIKEPEDIDKVTEKVEKMGEEEKPCENDACKDKDALDVFSDAKELADMKGTCSPEEAPGEAPTASMSVGEGKKKYPVPKAVEERFTACLAAVHGFADNVVMQRVRKDSEAANKVYGEAAENVAKRLELIASFKPSFLAINADHTQNVATLLGNAQEVMNAIDELVSRKEPTTKITNADGSGDCDDEEEKDKEEGAEPGGEAKEGEGGGA